MKFEDYLKEEFPDKWETEWTDSDILEEGMEYSLNSGGKRIRPLLCLKLCEELGGDLDQARTFARAVETFHNYTLVHDDIQDGDRYRRNQESVWQRFGEPQAISIGNGLNALSRRYLLENRELFEEEKLLELLQILNRADTILNEGQTMDIAFREKESISEEEYMEMARKKTGSLIKASLEGAVVIAEEDGATRRHVERFGERIGPAFQIRDDVIDLTGDKGRGSRGQDVREGKRSLVVVKALNRLEESRSRKLLDILDKSKEETSREEVETAIEFFRSVGAIEDANEVAEDLAEQAQEELEQVEREVDEIVEISDFLVGRKF